MELSEAFLQSQWLGSVVRWTVVLAAGSLVLLGGVVVVWRHTRSTLVRFAFVPVVAFAALLAMGAVPVPIEEGTWACAECEQSREEFRVFDRILFASATDHTDCDHAWIPIGCHVHGDGMVACYRGLPR